MEETEKIGKKLFPDPYIELASQLRSLLVVKQLNVPPAECFAFLGRAIYCQQYTGAQLELLQTEKYVFMLWGRTGREEVCCCIGNTVMNVDKSSLNIIFGNYYQCPASPARGW